MADWQPLDHQEFLSLESYRQDGSGVKTPLWFAEDGGALYIWTAGDSFKVKRIRRNPRVRVASCKRFGQVTGDWIEAEARIDESAAAVAHVEALLRRKLGFGFAVFRLIDRVRDRWKASRRVCLKVTLPADPVT